jgi:hypothetical protein
MCGRGRGAKRGVGVGGLEHEQTTHGSNREGVEIVFWINNVK